MLTFSRAPHRKAVSPAARARLSEPPAVGAVAALAGYAARAVRAAVSPFLLCALALVAPAAADDVVAIPVAFHVVERADGSQVADAAFLDAQIARANTIFEPLAIRFERAAVTSLPARHVVLSTRAERDALFPYVAAFGVHCMVVGSLMDVDEPGRERRGVHWVKRGATRPHLVVLSAIARPNVLAHELGHYLGVRQHSTRHGNVMSYDWGDGVPVFDTAQAARIHDTVRRMRQRREL